METFEGVVVSMIMFGVILSCRFNDSRRFIRMMSNEKCVVYDGIVEIADD